MPGITGEDSELRFSHPGLTYPNYPIIIDVRLSNEEPIPKKLVTEIQKQIYYQQKLNQYRMDLDS